MPPTHTTKKPTFRCRSPILHAPLSTRTIIILAEHSHADASADRACLLLPHSTSILFRLLVHAVSHPPPLQPPRSTTLAPSETIGTATNVVSLVVMGPNSRSSDGQCGGTNSAEGLSIRHILLHARVGCHAYGLSVWMYRAASDWWLVIARRSLGLALPS